MQETWSFKRVAGPYDFTEGPVWYPDDAGGSVLFTEVPSNRILRYDPSRDVCQPFRADTGGANGLAIGEGRTLYACESTYRRVVMYDGGNTSTSLATTYDGERLNGPNDLCLDSDGAIWFSDPNFSGDPDIQDLPFEAVYRLTPDGALVRATMDTSRPSGVQVSPDGDYLYVADARFRGERVQQLLSYPINEDRSIGEKCVLHDFGGHRGVDGLSVTSDGKIVAAAGWERSGQGPAVYVFTPCGELEARHPFPTDRPTNCTFAGRDLRTLYVTGGGCLFRVETDYTGYRHTVSSN